MTLRYGLVAAALALCFSLAHADDTTSTTLASIEPDASAPVAQVSPQDLWQRMRNRFALPNVDDELVRRHEAYYAAHPEYLARIFDRGGKYLHFIVEEVERRNMPAEIALLPMIESAYDPKAYSRARAAGIWQFIPSTGARYGLEQTYWYDGRCDVFAATGAALDYLQFLYATFGDWQLALAAYNWGEGGVSRAVAHNQAQGQAADYNSINMPWETRNYVPKLLAIRNIIANPQLFSITLPTLENKPALAVVTTNRHMDLAVAASLANMSEREFLELNPGYKRPVIAYKSERRLLLPIDRAQTFVDNLNAREQPLLNWAPYQVARGDNIAKLAERYHCAADELRRVNKVSGNRLRPGLVVLVPHSEADSAATRTCHVDIPGDRALTMKPGAVELPLSAAQPTASTPIAVTTVDHATPPNPPAAASAVVANVAASAATATPDTAAVAPRTVSAQAASSSNGTPSATAPVVLTTPDPAVTPAPIAIASATVPPVSAGDATDTSVGYHTVTRNDTAYNIAHRYGLSVSELLSLNGLHRARLHIGQNLRIAGLPSAPQASTVAANHPARVQTPAVHKHKPSTENYLVRRGDTPASIARHFNVEVVELMRWNKLKHAASLRAGETVVIRLAYANQDLPD